MTRSGPLFTVVIPTRNRRELLQEGIAAAMAQTFSDFEVVILENSDAEQRILEPPPGVSVRRAERVLSMPDNWERLFESAQGRYVVLLSDKDRLIPSALEVMAALLQRDEVDILTFRKAVSIDGAWVPPPALDGQARMSSTRDVLHRWFDEVIYIIDAPMLYNSAISRDLLLSIRDRHGHFFCGACPDVSSSLSVLADRGAYLDVNRRLAASCSGSWGNGVAVNRGLHGRASSFVAEFGTNPLHRAGLVFSVVGSVAETLMACKARDPNGFRDYEIDWDRYVSNTIEVLLDRQVRGLETWPDWRRLVQQAGPVYPLSTLWSASPTAIRGLAKNQLRRAMPAGSRLGDAARRFSWRLGLRNAPPAAVSVTSSEMVARLDGQNRSLPLG